MQARAARGRAACRRRRATHCACAAGWAAGPRAWGSARRSWRRTWRRATRSTSPRTCRWVQCLGRQRGRARWRTGVGGWVEAGGCKEHDPTDLQAGVVRSACVQWLAVAVRRVLGVCRCLPGWRSGTCGAPTRPAPCAPRRAPSRPQVSPQAHAEAFVAAPTAGGGGFSSVDLVIRCVRLGGWEAGRSKRSLAGRRRCSGRPPQRRNRAQLQPPAQAARHGAPLSAPPPAVPPPPTQGRRAHGGGGDRGGAAGAPGGAAAVRGGRARVDDAHARRRGRAGPVPPAGPRQAAAGQAAARV